MRLFLIEDEEDLNNILSKWLRKIRYTLDIAIDGIDEYDLVILDLSLLSIDGIEILLKLVNNNKE